MNQDDHTLHVATLRREMDWLARLLDTRLLLLMQQPEGAEPAPALHALHDLAAPPLDGNTSALAELVRSAGLGFDERAIVALALAPHLRPTLLDALFMRNPATDRRHSEFGGVAGRDSGGFLPTIETALFLLAGDDLGRRLAVMAMFEPDSALSRLGLLAAVDTSASTLPTDAPLRLAADMRSRLVLGRRDSSQATAPVAGREAPIPAQPLTSGCDWDALEVAPETREGLARLQAWLQHRKELATEWPGAQGLPAGHRAQFVGPAGTGKATAAALLGRATGREVYRVDLAALRSPYAGETEKNIDHLFALAERRNAILFIDSAEADELFGRAGNTPTPEGQAWRQRMARHPGLVIVATEQPATPGQRVPGIQTTVPFTPPDAAQRERLWRSQAGSSGKLSRDVDLARLAAAHDLTAGEIAQALSDAALEALRRGRSSLDEVDLTRAIAAARRYR
ncbi:AAA family ATPase [Leptothrix sp. BB-4]